MRARFRFPFLIPILFLLVACVSAPTPTTATPLPSPTAQTLPPAVVETSPPIGSQIGLTTPITIYFSEAMERASVETSIRSPDVERFLFIWLNDATLQITPVQPFPIDKEIQITLGTSVKTARGLNLPQEVTLSYRTPGLLTVTQVLPAPQADAISPDSAIVAAFNQPVVPLGAEAASLPVGFTLEPAVNGRGEWLNTSTYIFYPDPALAGGIEYTVRINNTLKSTAGTPLDAKSPNQAWAFRTALPEVLEISPATRTLLPIDGKIQITFNQPMDKASVEAAFRLQDAQAKLVTGNFEWNERGTVVTFVPQQQLARDT
ncbi:MAG: hypothetical protein DDG60_02385, partial [Anaerolineae bacterium]